jgi:hypothetical protein
LGRPAMLMVRDATSAEQVERQYSRFL